jgi:hypothetical protein
MTKWTPPRLSACKDLVKSQCSGEILLKSFAAEDVTDQLQLRA